MHRRSYNYEPGEFVLIKFNLICWELSFLQGNVREHGGYVFITIYLYTSDND